MATLNPKTESTGKKYDPSLFHGLVDSVRAIVWRRDAYTLRFTFVSQMAEQILGYPPALWISDPDFWVSHIHPEDRDSVVRLCQEATRLFLNHEFEYRMIAADGAILWLRDIVNVKTEAGEATELTGVMVDITEQQNTQEAL